MPPTERLRWSLLSGYPVGPYASRPPKVPSDSRPREVTIVAEGSRDARYNARRAAVRRGGRVDAALGACRTDLRIMWRPLLVIRVSQLVSRAADHR